MPDWIELGPAGGTCGLGHRGCPSRLVVTAQRGPVMTCSKLRVQRRNA